jgi:hypothetical protein
MAGGFPARPSTLRGPHAQAPLPSARGIGGPAQRASNPMLGIEKIKETFDTTFHAMDAMDTFRAKSIHVMGQSDKLIRDRLT